MDYLENKKYKVIWLNSFKHELSHNYYYLSNNLKAPSAANKLHRKVFKTLSSLSYFPERYQKTYCNKDIRKIPLGKYIILYTVDHAARQSFYLTYFS